MATIEGLQENHNLTDDHLDCEIGEERLFSIAEMFGSWSQYVETPGLGLSRGEKAQIMENLTLNTNTLRMKEALKIWRSLNPYTATFRKLLSILLSLNTHGDVIQDVCKYLSSNPHNIVPDTLSRTPLGQDMNGLTNNGDHRSSASSDTDDTWQSDSDSDEAYTTVPSLPDKRYVRFKCGCGTCSLTKYIAGKNHCRSSELTSEPPQFKVWIPEHPDDVTAADTNYLVFLGALQTKYREIHSAFISLLFNTFILLKENGVALTRVKTFIKALFRPPGNKYYCQIYNKRIDGKLREVKTFEDLRTYLHKNYCSWYNYEIIEELRKEFLFDDVEEDNKMNKYEERCKYFVNRRCFLYLNDVGPNPGDQTQVVCKVEIDFQELHPKQIKKMQLLVMGYLDVPKYSITLKQVREGCTELVFRAPACLEELKELTPHQIQELSDNKFLEITIGGRPLFKSVNTSLLPVHVKEMCSTTPNEASLDSASWSGLDVQLNNQECSTDISDISGQSDSTDEIPGVAALSSQQIKNSLQMAECLGSTVKIKAASDALRGHFSALVKTIDPLMVAIQLYSEKIIDSSTLDRIRSVTSTTKTEKACDVLSAVSDLLTTNPDVFSSFCAVLESEPVTEERAKLLKGDYERFLQAEHESNLNGKEVLPSRCECTKLQMSFLNELKKRLEILQDIKYGDQKKVKPAIEEYITSYIQAGCSSSEHLIEHLLLLHEKESLITDPTIFLWAKQLAADKFSEMAVVQESSALLPSPEKRPPLFSKPVLYHAGICSLAVNKCTAGDYQKFFKDKEFIPGHSFKEVSISRSKQDRYLIATQYNSTHFIAFQSEPDVSEWPKKYKSFDEGITAQTKKFPIRFITELLNNDENRVVLTGFSYGGLLACSVATQVWHSPYYISSRHLQENLVCITFAQPHLSVPQLAEVARDCPEIASSIHAIYYEEDPVPRLMKVLDLPCSTLGKDNTEAGLQIKVKELPKSPIHAIYYEEDPVPRLMKVLDLPCSTLGRDNTEAGLQIKVNELPKSPIHAIYYEEDPVPRLMKVLDLLPCSTLGKDNTEAGLQIKVKELPKSPFQDPLTLSLFTEIGLLLNSKFKPSLSEPGKELVEALKGVIDCLMGVSGASQPMTYHQLSYSSGSPTCLLFTEMTRDQIAIQTSHLKADELQHLTTEVGNKHSMEMYCRKMHRGYLEKDPEYKIPPLAEMSPEPVGSMRPIVSGITIHEHGSEIALVMEGRNLWFCFQLSVNGENTSTHACAISGTSIKLNFDKDSRTSLSSLTDGEEVKVKVHNRFFKSPPPADVKVQKKEYPVNTRQRQLARLTPSQIIELAYLSALLEQHPYSSFQPLSHKVCVIRDFLKQVAEVVPLESVGYAVAFGNHNVALHCAKAINDSFEDMPPSILMRDGLSKATARLLSGMSSDIGKHMHEELRYQEFPDTGIVTYNFRSDEEKHTLSLEMWPADDPTRTVTKSYPLHELKRRYNLEPDTDLMSQVKSLNYIELQHKVYDTVQKEGKVHNVICGLSISSLYANSSQQLKSPIDTLRIGKEKLFSLSKESAVSNCEPRTGTSLSQSPPPQTSSKRMSSNDNSLMLQTVNEIRQNELAICISLLGGFMEQHEVDIPLTKSEKDHSKVLNLSARASVGMWALSSLDFEHIQPILKQCHCEQLLVKIKDYVKGIVTAKAMEAPPDDNQYAAKLQFIVQGVRKNVTCNSQYISYSLERQLADLCQERSITEAIPLARLTEQWDLRFEKNILSLVAKSHRPLIARWLKWALMVHNLREELAKYTAVGVVGLVNSGKSRLVNSLFGIQIPSGTTEEKRTTVPFIYNMEARVEGLDIVDFPGVDDSDESISELADLLLTLAQIIIFVVDYRKIHTESGKKWLDRLQVEKVPVLVCLTYADKLYAEHMTKDGQHPDKRFMKQKLTTQLSMIQEKLKLPSSHQIKFCSFSQDNDSVLNNEPGRQKLRDVGIETPSGVGDWLVEIFRKRFVQEELADRLSEFLHSGV